jgi:hypothetical protein
MEALRILRDAFKADGWGTAALVACILAGCLALTSADWANAALLLSLSAVFSVFVREKVRPDTERSMKWSRRVFVAAGIGFLGVACANALTGDVFGAVAAGLVGAVYLIGVAWRAPGARRSETST